MGQFATNMAAIKYDCPNEEVTEKVLFLYNEKPMEMEGCVKGLCNWDDIKSKFAKYTNGNCRDVFCSEA